MFRSRVLPPSEKQQKVAPTLTFLPLQNVNLNHFRSIDNHKFEFYEQPMPSVSELGMVRCLKDSENSSPVDISVSVNSTHTEDKTCVTALSELTMVMSESTRSRSPCQTLVNNINNNTANYTQKLLQLSNVNCTQFSEFNLESDESEETGSAQCTCGQYQQRQAVNENQKSNLQGDSKISCKSSKSRTPRSKNISETEKDPYSTIFQEKSNITEVNLNSCFRFDIQQLTSNLQNKSSRQTYPVTIATENNTTTLNFGITLKPDKNVPAKTSHSTQSGSSLTRLSDGSDESQSDVSRDPNLLVETDNNKSPHEAIEGDSQTSSESYEDENSSQSSDKMEIKKPRSQRSKEEKDDDDDDTTEIKVQRQRGKTALFKEFLSRCNHNSFFVTSEHNSMWKDPLSASTASKEDTGLANALGISSESLLSERVAERKKSIQKKMQEYAPLMPVFTNEEEFDIHCRAESYASNVIPDPDYYITCGSVSVLPLDRRDKSQLLWQNTTRGRKRKKSVCEAEEQPTIVQNDAYPFYTYCITPGDGTQLLKPPNKLVELVAQAINDSPDGMLQVQQVYIVLMNKYPYFQHYDKSSQTSWKSSIRHALYQKWFIKIDNFSMDIISVRGCYWAINREQTPKDWSLPVSKYITQYPHNKEVMNVSRGASLTAAGPHQDKKYKSKPKCKAKDARDEGHLDLGTVMTTPPSPSSRSSQVTDEDSSDSDSDLSSELSRIDDIAHVAGRGEKTNQVLRDITHKLIGCSQGNHNNSQNEAKCDPDPILNNLNAFTQSSDLENLDSPEDVEISSDLMTTKEPDNTYFGVLPALAIDNEAEAMDLYIPVSSELPFYIALPLDDDLQIFD